MTLDTRERSVYGGNPVSLYRLSIGSTVYRLTSADSTIASAADGDVQIYQPHAISHGGIQLSQEQGSGEVEIELTSDHPVAQAHRFEGPAVPVAVTIYRMHYDDGQTAVAFTGRVASVLFEPGVATLKCAPLDLRPAIPRVYFQKRCNWALYSPPCGVLKATYKVSGTVMAFSGFQLRAAILATQPDGWFKGGWIELADATRRFIVEHVAETVTLRSPFPVLAIAQAIDAYPGCDRLKATCRDKYGNLPNFSGFPDIATRNPFTEGMS